MNIKRMVTGLLAALALWWAPAVYADNQTEFGIGDDLTVLGTAGAGADPDLEVKGFTVFGSTQATYPGPVTGGPGNVVVNGVLAVSSGMYVAGSSTFTSTVDLPDPTSLFVTGGSEGNILTKNAATGALRWDSISSYVSGDNLGSHIATTTLHMDNNEIMDAGHITASSMTLTETLDVGGTSTFVSSMTVKGDTQLGDDPTIDVHSINGPTEAGVALNVVGADDNTKYTAKFYSGLNLAAWIKKK